MRAEFVCSRGENQGTTPGCRRSPTVASRKAVALVELFRWRSAVCTAMLTAITVALSGCNGKLIVTTAIQVFPNSASLYTGQSQQFSAKIYNAASQSVNWTIQPAGVGTINDSGLYTAPPSIAAQSSVAITATSQAAPSASNTAVITLLPPSIHISPSSATVYSGQTQQFTATIAGASNQSVIWSISPTGAGTINNAGLYTAPAQVLSQRTITVVATSVVEPSLSSDAPVILDPPGVITLTTQPLLGLNGLCGAFTDENGAVIEPIAVGDGYREFVVPDGATQIQLGVNDDKYSDNLGTGFQVAVDRVPITIPPTAMPWNWEYNGLNQSYIFGLQDGTNPVVALKQLSPGTVVSVQYLGGTSQPGDPSQFAPSDAIGQLDWNLRTSLFPGEYTSDFMTPIAAQTGTAIPITLSATDILGSPIAGATIEIAIAGANSQQLSATTDATGTAALSYQGTNPGTDSVSAVAVLNGQVVATTPTPITLAWLGGPRYSEPVPLGSLTLNYPIGWPVVPLGYVTEYQLLAQDPTGNPVPDLAVTIQTLGANPGTTTLTTNTSGLASGSFANNNPGVSFIESYALIDGFPVFSVGKPVAALTSVLLSTTPVILQGWIATPLNDSVFLRSAPIVFSLGGILNDAVLYLIPVADPDVPAIETSFSGQAQTIDASQLQAGRYWILVTGQDSQGESENSLVEVNLQ
jgi:Big-like domain-containing protein